ncbi:suppressor of Mek1-like [Daktulosphaira vitifoliae]|uniref:suppressor of Mek1-like n=1 Tax=Daktulosphaira vitifoliae TaxID=58002 RepID=UPI0021A9A003|nr:suppressor of Mek1-like [Daktulosphaira vitifoliae]
MKLYTLSLFIAVAIFYPPSSECCLDLLLKSFVQIFNPTIEAGPTRVLSPHDYSDGIVPNHNPSNNIESNRVGDSINSLSAESLKKDPQPTNNVPIADYEDKSNTNKRKEKKLVLNKKASEDDYNLDYEDDCFSSTEEKDDTEDFNFDEKKTYKEQTNIKNNRPKVDNGLESDDCVSSKDSDNTSKKNDKNIYCDESNKSKKIKNKKLESHDVSNKESNNVEWINKKNSKHIVENIKNNKDVENNKSKGKKTLSNIKTQKESCPVEKVKGQKIIGSKILTTGNTDSTNINKKKNLVENKKKSVNDNLKGMGKNEKMKNSSNEKNKEKKASKSNIITGNSHLDKNINKKTTVGNSQSEEINKNTDVENDTNNDLYNIQIKDSYDIFGTDKIYSDDYHQPYRNYDNREGSQRSSYDSQSNPDAYGTVELNYIPGVRPITDFFISLLEHIQLTSKANLQKSKDDSEVNYRHTTKPITSPIKSSSRS